VGDIAVAIVVEDDALTVDIDLEQLFGLHLVGLGRFGSTVLQEFQERGYDVLAIDFDPRSVQSPRFDVPVIYGDAEDPDLPEHLPLHRARWVISTLRDVGTSRHLIDAFRHHGFRGGIVVSADTEDEARELEQAGADLVCLPLTAAAGPLMDTILARDRERTADDIDDVGSDGLND
jgi:Trk K+ transport system NAD-binding subunit